MELKDAVDVRRTIRDFSSKDIPQQIVDYAVENAFKAPTYNHLREWDFIILRSDEAKRKLITAESLDGDADMQELERLFADEEPIMKDMYLDAIPKQKKMMLEAPLVVIVAYKPKTMVEEAKKVYDLNCLASVWACIENFLLSLAENDIFGVTFIPQNTPAVKKMFGIPPHLEVAAVIPIGYKAENARILKQRPVSIETHKHYERW